MRKNGMKYRSNGVPKNSRASRIGGASAIPGVAVGRGVPNRRLSFRAATPMTGAVPAEPVVDHYPLVVRVLIFGAFAAAAWGGLIGGIQLISETVRHWG